MNQLIQTLLTSTIIMGAVGASQSLSADTPFDKDVAAQFLSAWDRAWANHDANALEELHTMDAVTVNRFGTLVEGRAATQKALAFLHSKDGPFGQSAFPPLKLLVARHVKANVIIVQAGWQNPVMNPDGKTSKTKVNDMIVTFVLVREGTNWKASEVDAHNIEKMDLPFSNPGQKDR